jgi:signal transduction histidine kinase
VRHATASQARLQITYTPEMVSLEISDNGSGFEVPESPSAFASSGHYGLLGLYERAEMIGAQLEIQSAPRQGARITVILPLSNSTPGQV